MTFSDSRASPTTTGEHWNAPTRTAGQPDKRTCPADSEYGSWVKYLKPEIIIGNTSRRANKLEEGQQGATGAATNIVHTFISSQAHLLILESTPYLLKSAAWTDDPLTTPVNHTLLLESDQDVCSTGRGPLNQEQNVYYLFPKPSER